MTAEEDCHCYEQSVDSVATGDDGWLALKSILNKRVWQLAKYGVPDTMTAGGEIAARVMPHYGYDGDIISPEYVAVWSVLSPHIMEHFRLRRGSNKTAVKKVFLSEFGLMIVIVIVIVIFIFCNTS